MELKPGDKLGSHQIVSAMGEGDMGDVWKARDAQAARNVVRISVRDGDGKAMAARNKGTGIP